MYLAILLGWILGVATMGNTTLLALNFAFVPTLLLNICCWLLLYVFFSRSRQVYLRLIVAMVSALLSFLLGLSYADLELEQRLSYRETQKQELHVIVYVRQISELKPYALQQRLEVINRHPKVVTWMSSQNTDHGKPVHEFQLGHYYRIQGTLRPTQSYANPGGFDSEKWAIQQNILASIRLKQVEEISEQQVQAEGLSHYVRQQQGVWKSYKLKIEQQRLKLRRFIQKQPLKHRGLLLALLSGDESLLDSHTEKLFQRFGISHLLAISGPHVLVFAMMVCWCLQYFLARYRSAWFLIRPRAELLLVPFNLCVVLYCAFVGFEIPAVRTLIISLTLSVLLLLHIRLSTFALLSMSASILLWFDPFSVLSAAFWLSYGACFILLRVYQTLTFKQPEGVLSWSQQMFRAARILFESQWKIFLALLPMMLIFFKQLTWIAPVSNFIAIPLIGVLIVPLDILATLCFFLFKPLATVFFQLNDVLIGFLLAMLQLLDRLFKPELHWFALDYLSICCLVFGLILLFLPRGVCPKSWAALCVIPLVLPNTQRHSFELDILDVGQGQAIYLRDSAKSAMIDVGGYYDEAKFSVAERIVLPFLSVKGNSQLDYVFLSHLDTDHSGAFDGVRKQVEIGQVLSNQLPKNINKQSFDYCQQGQRWQWNSRVSIEVLSPKAAQLAQVPFHQNTYSCVLLIRIQEMQKEQRILLMGDADWQTEYQLLQDYPNLTVDYLLLGHHGSQHSSAYDFLKQLQPRFAIVSAGLNNSYGHPSVQVQARLAALNIPLIEISQTGALQFYLNAQGQLEHRSYRGQKRWLARS